MQRKLRINPAIYCRILKCEHCCEWIEVFSDSFRGFAKLALAHLPECSRKDLHPDYDGDPSALEFDFTIITERKFELEEA